VRRLLVVVSVVVFVDAMLYGVLAPLVHGYAHDFALSKTGAGLLVAAFGTGAFAGGIPGGLAAQRWGPKRTVLLGLGLMAFASLAFAIAGDPWTLGVSRFTQGMSSSTTWAGALAWLTVLTSRDRRGQVLGTVFGTAVFGAILGPMVGAAADLIGIRPSFLVMTGLALVLLVSAAAMPAAPVERQRPGALAQAARDYAFLAGLWFNTLPALLFGTATLLVPLALGDAGFTPFGIGAVFLCAGMLESALNPIVGRLSDRYGRFRPARVALAASAVVATALAFTSEPFVLAALMCAASLTFGGFYTPGMALVSDRAEHVGLAQGLAFGVMNSAWALGNLAGPALGGTAAERWGDATPYLAGAVLCLLTLVAAQRLRGTRPTPRTPVSVATPPGRQAP
jgi:predicted MFS family arabinose efflux permease